MKRTSHDPGLANRLNAGSRTGARLDRLLSRHRTPSPDRMQAAIDRVSRQIGAAAIPPSRSAVKSAGPSRAWLAAAATLAVATTVSIAMLWPERTGPLHSLLDSVLEGTVHEGNTLWTNGGNAQLRLTDGSRVEMRSKSEIALERAVDGIRIRLDRGGIIVNAAKQRTGHLYVQTKEMTVSVVGTVFLVNADTNGSRVAVVEGEVRVQQGTTEKTLLSGQQAASNPEMASPPVQEAIAWSRNAPALLDALQQAAVVPPVVAVQAPTERRETFDLISIRPSAPPSGSGRGSVPIAGCAGGTPEIDPARFAFTGATLQAVIVWAYGTRDGGAQTCLLHSMLNVIGGGPGWVRSDQWDIQAAMPAGAAGDPQRLRRMAQVMLENRFGLVMRREMKTVPAYVVTLAGSPSRYAASNDAALWLTDKPERDGLERLTGVGQDRDVRRQALWARNAAMADLLPLLERLTGRPVVDRTGLTGRFSFSFWYDTFPDADGSAGGIARPLNPQSATSLLTAIRDLLGFQMQATTTPIEGWVIERAEKPTEN